MKQSNIQQVDFFESLEQNPRLKAYLEMNAEGVLTCCQHIHGRKKMPYQEAILFANKILDAYDDALKQIGRILLEPAILGSITIYTEAGEEVIVSCLDGHARIVAYESMM